MNDSIIRNELWNDGWEFVKLPSGSTRDEMRSAQKMPVVLPHDWLIFQAEDLYETSDGWYRKTFTVTEEDQNNPRILSFDGVYMDAEVLVDDQLVCEHRYGYTSFHVFLPLGLTVGEHEVIVHVRYVSPNTRWYSGAGIFRDVRFRVLPDCFLVPDGVRIEMHPAAEGVYAGSWLLKIKAETGRYIISSEGAADANRPLAARLVDENGRLIAHAAALAAPVTELMMEVDVRPWSTEDPVLYTLVLSLEGQEERFPIGFRETACSPKEGFFLNGKHVKLHGVCLHHDLGILGAAFSETAALRQLLLMKKMGANAVRTSHNPPARQFLDLCDRLGLLVIDEFTDMWEMPKTEFDYARFFPECYEKDIACWVRRDRTHPCVVFWSIGNEIPDMNASEKGALWTRLLADAVRMHDDTHAYATFGSNYMPWEGAQNCADIIKIPGYNYAEKYYETHHAKHPDWVIYGSETASLVLSRGIYHFPAGQMILSEEDLQCSALLNSNTSWGAQNLPKMLADDLNTPYSMGQFIWSGIDYIGEPTPYHTRSSYFGQADTACFPKDSYYLYQAMWTDEPMIHIGVYWDWNEGQMIDVPVMTNASRAELFLNGRSLGVKEVNRLDPEHALPVWKIAYEPGILYAAGYDSEGSLLCEARESSFFEPVQLEITLQAMPDGREDLLFAQIEAVDRDGYPVRNAVNRIHVSVEGSGRLLGLDNGDSADLDGYRTDSRCLFSGKLLAMVDVSGENSGTVLIRAASAGLKGASLKVSLPGLAQTDAEDTKNTEEAAPKETGCTDTADPYKEEMLLTRKIELTALEDPHLNPDHASALFAARLLPENCMPQEIHFRAVNALGVDIPWAKIEIPEDRETDGKTPEPGSVLVRVRASGDGEFYLRASVNNGYEHPRILSSMELSAEGFGHAGADPYRFVSAALYDETLGEITSGNEKGISFSRDGFSAAGYRGLDFGPAGSDEITLPVFSLDDDPCEIGLWDGKPTEDGRKIMTLLYHKKSIWNVYQEETWKLPEVLKGSHDLWFSMNRKIHLKGFAFSRISNAAGLRMASEADRIYGDSFRKEEDGVYGIGNNVTLVFENLYFAKEETIRLKIDGSTDLDVQPIGVRLKDSRNEERQFMCRFTGGGRSEQTFEIEVPRDLCSISFVFLPGSRFDFFHFILEN